MKQFKSYQIYFEQDGKERRRTTAGRNKEEAILNLKQNLNYNNINNYKITKIIKVK